MDVDTSDSAGRCLTAVGRGTRPEASVLVLQSDCGETISRDRSTLFPSILENWQGPTTEGPERLTLALLAAGRTERVCGQAQAS